jgi:hypothetical protein
MPECGWASSRTGVSYAKYAALVSGLRQLVGAVTSGRIAKRLVVWKRKRSAPCKATGVSPFNKAGRLRVSSASSSASSGGCAGSFLALWPCQDRGVGGVGADQSLPVVAGLGSHRQILWRAGGGRDQPRLLVSSVLRGKAGHSFWPLPPNAGTIDSWRDDPRPDGVAW